ncbi:MAG: histidine kinase [Bacteroidia bacterium]
MPFTLRARASTMHQNDNDFIFLIIVTSVALTFVAVLFTAIVIRYSKLRARRQEELLKATYVAQEMERNRIAEDMHDDIGPRLSALKFSVEALNSELDSDNRNDIATETNDSLDHVIRQIRGIVRNLSSKYIAEKGIIHQLHEVKKQFEQNGRIKIELNLDDLNGKYDLDKDFEVNLFRVLQELTNNSVKYSEGNRINIDVVKTGDLFKINYADNGKGFDSDNVNKGLGLNSIDARIRLYKGLYQVITSPDKGVRYEMVFNADNILEKAKTE